MSIIKGQEITAIHYNTQPDTGETTSVELWQKDGIVTVTDKEDISLIERILGEVKRINGALKLAGKKCPPLNPMEYLTFGLSKAGW